MQYQIPQFIDIEDKIVGPLTFKQFIYIAGSLGICFISYRLLPFWIAALIILPTAILGGALAFYKINGKPFMFTLEAWFNFMLQSKLYIWKQRKPEKKQEVKKPDAPITPNKEEKRVLTSSKLHDIAWSLDVLDTNKRGSKNTRL